ncbi:MAG TPA: sugar phosphate isomerase/epimerase family protein [Opitutales bacterium]|nr:sugar phosphate isomerase/epimerase family protein [Opitutales bacterium]
MPATALTDFSRLCLHTITTKPWSLDVACREYARAGVKGISVWRDTLAGRDVPAAGRQLRDAGLSIVSLVRGGFFPAADATGRQKAIDENRRCIDEAAALGAPIIVLVCGAVAGQPLAESRRQIAAGIAAVLPHAKAAGVKLAIEPLHPMYADTRSAINTLKQANDLAAQFDAAVGVAVDVYHLWWDDQLEAEIARCGRLGKLLAYHVCDWRSPTVDFLNDRGLMGEGCIPLREIRGWVEAAGFGGFIEVEIFSNRLWQLDQVEFLRQIQEAYLRHS